MKPSQVRAVDALVLSQEDELLFAGAPKSLDQVYAAARTDEPQRSLCG